MRNNYESSDSAKSIDIGDAVRSTTLTQIELLEKFGIVVLISVANDMQSKNPKWRYGQCLFNALYAIDNKMADEIRATDNDCFYQNDKIGKFLIEVETKLKT